MCTGFHVKSKKSSKIYYMSGKTWVYLTHEVPVILSGGFGGLNQSKILPTDHILDGNCQVQNLVRVEKFGKTCDQQLELSRTHQHLLNLCNFQLSHLNVENIFVADTKFFSQRKVNTLL